MPCKGFWTLKRQKTRQAQVRRRLRGGLDPGPSPGSRARSAQQRIHPFHISRRVCRQAAFGQHGLVKQDVGQVVEVH
jgi:hypothetical protein